MKRLGSITAAVALVLVGGLTGCRGGDSEGSDGTATDIGVTKEPCPSAVDKAKGCIYLGSISDLTVGPFKALAVPITEAQKAFWKRVNTQGGIGGYEIDAETYVRDNKYNPQTHNEVYQEIKGKVLALAQSLGSPTTAAILPDMKANDVIAAPAAWTSAYAFEDNILESGANYCFESMNAVDYALEQPTKPKSVMAVHLAGDYGDDAAAGAKIAAEKNGLTFFNVKTDSGQDKQSGAIGEIVARKPDLVIITAGPADVAAVVGGAAARGFTGKFIGTSPSWNPGLLTSAAAPALKALYLQSAPWKTWSTESVGHQAMRTALPGVTPNDGYVSGWVWSYPLRAALQKAATDGDLSRKGLLKAAKSLTSVDYEGILPTGAGNYAGGPDGQFRQSIIANPAGGNGTTVVPTVKDYFVGPTAKDYKLDRPCFEKL